ncbi:hypothetical protein ElyMa_000719700 [Elysia marginata]|uniref:Uncharacterized protein n=1 Tax=Elysia marginata TaxID=1093978 RepID=A0AAV4GPW7_9GAST|nr:hypothetical protein ElyMa_000719700 [Elysia marginata]
MHKFKRVSENFSGLSSSSPKPTRLNLNVISLIASFEENYITHLELQDIHTYSHSLTRLTFDKTRLVFIVGRKRAQINHGICQKQTTSLVVGFVPLDVVQQVPAKAASGQAPHGSPQVNSSKQNNNSSILNSISSNQYIDSSNTNNISSKQNINCSNLDSISSNQYIDSSNANNISCKQNNISIEQINNEAAINISSSSNQINNSSSSNQINNSSSSGKRINNSSSNHINNSSNNSKQNNSSSSNSKQNNSNISKQNNISNQKDIIRINHNQKSLDQPQNQQLQ